MLDPQVLLDPFEKQLDLPLALVETADRRRGQCHLFGQEHQGFRRLGVAEPDPTQMDRVVLAGLHAIEAMVWSAMMPVLRSVGDEYTRRASRLDLARDKLGARSIRKDQSQNTPKFFASFFQKRRPSLPLILEQGGRCCVLLATSQGTGHA